MKDRNDRTKKTFFAILVCMLLGGVFVCLDRVYTAYVEKPFPVRNDVYLQQAAPSLHVRSKVTGLHYEQRPYYNFKGRFTTNSYGMRGPEPAKVKTVPRILIMGDSVIAGLDYRDSLLASSLAQETARREKCAIEVLNAGVSCYNTKQEYIALKEKYLSLRPDLVIFFFCANDFSDAGIQSDPTEYAQRIIAKRQPGRQGWSFLQSLSWQEYLAIVLPKQFPLMFAWDRWLLIHSGVYRAASLYLFCRREGITDMRGLSSYLFSFDMQKVLLDIVRLARDNRFGVVFVLSPAKFPWNKEKILSLLHQQDIAVWDFDDTFRRQGAPAGDIWRDDGFHFNLLGHQLVGQMLGAHILDFFRDGSTNPPHRT